MVLEDRPERGLGGVAVERLRAEERQRVRPIDGLGHSGPLGHVESPQLGHGGRHLGRQGSRNLGGAHPDDLDLALERGVVDPVVQAPPLQRVM